MKDLLNSISVLATFVTIIGLIYLLLDNTIGRYERLKEATIYKTIYLKDVVFVVIATAITLILLLLNVISLYKPW